MSFLGWLSSSLRRRPGEHPGSTLKTYRETNSFRIYRRCNGRSCSHVVVEYNILHRADVRYRYEVSGRQYESDVFTFGVPHSFDKRADAETEIATYAVGRHVSVRYDPSSPETSCINPGTVPEQFAVLAWMSGACLVAGLVSIISGSLTLKRAT